MIENDPLLNKKKKNLKTLNEETDNEDLYSVEEIKMKKKINKKWHYYIKWVNYPENQNTWEPRENLLCEELLKEFEKKWYEKQKGKLKKLKKSLKNENILGENEIRNHNKIKESEDLSNDYCENHYNEDNKKIKKREEKNILSSMSLSNFSQQETINENKINQSNNLEASLTSKKSKLDETCMPDVENKGNLDFNIPKKILSARLNHDKSLNFLIMWRKKNGFKPNDSFISNEDLKKHKYYDMIIDFYELRTRFQNEVIESKKIIYSNESTNENK